MPHLHIDYSSNLDPDADLGRLCRDLAGAMAALSHAGQSVFPLNGTRVLAYPAPFHAVAGGAPGNAFVYLNLRITPGRSADIVGMAGQTLLAVVRAHFDRLALSGAVGITLHIDEVAPAFEGRHRLG